MWMQEAPASFLLQHRPTTFEDGAPACSQALDTNAAALAANAAPCSTPAAPPCSSRQGALTCKFPAPVAHPSLCFFFFFLTLAFSGAHGEEEFGVRTW